MLDVEVGSLKTRQEMKKANEEHREVKVESFGTRGDTSGEWDEDGDGEGDSKLKPKGRRPTKRTTLHSSPAPKQAYTWRDTDKENLSGRETQSERMGKAGYGEQRSSRFETES